MLTQCRERLITCLPTSEVGKEIILLDEVNGPIGPGRCTSTSGMFEL